MISSFIDAVHSSVVESTDLYVVESEDSLHYYHLQSKGSRKSLCGKDRLISTKIKLSEWGQHDLRIKAHWCTKCATKAGNL